jgi:ankyrin repeat protein
VSQEIIDRLLTLGANINTEDSNNNKTALMIACSKGYIQLIEKLIQS